MKTFFKSLIERLRSLHARKIGAMLKVKLGRPIVNLLCLIARSIGWKMNLSLVKVIVTFVRSIHMIVRKSGTRFAVLYLKALSTMTMQSLGGHKLKDMSPVGLRFARTDRGLPRLIPALHRARIRKGDYLLMKFWLSMFALYRAVLIPCNFSLRSIVLPSTMRFELLQEFQTFVRAHFVPVVRELYSDSPMTDALWEDPMEFVRGLRSSPFLLAKSSPAVRRDADSHKESPISTSPGGVIHAAYLWITDPLYPFLKNWCELTGNLWVINRIESWTKGYDPSFLNSESLGTLGRLGFKEEAAGKMRIFAIVDPWTQWLMKPLHRGISSLLRLIPQDGTFDQLAPLDRLRTMDPRVPLYSLDLSTATDRLPLLIQKVLLSPFITNWGAELWGIILTGRPYSTGYASSSRVFADLDERSGGNWKDGSVWYGAGQPMGALSSWNMLAFAHHALVQFAAYRVNVTSSTKPWFEDYAVLGDDVVIAGREVARSYMEVMAHLGVGIALHKSLWSLKGTAMEFAKRFIIDNEDVSPNPIPELQVARVSIPAWLEYCRSHKLTLAQGLSILGYRYRATGSISKKLMSLPNRLRGYLVAWLSPSGVSPLTLKKWLLLKSINSYYGTEDRVQSLVTQFLDREIKRLIDRLDTLAPLLAEAKRLGTVYRDREHYGTVERSQDRRTVFKDLTSTTWAEYPSIADSVNEVVFREAFLDSVILARDLRTSLEETTVDSLTWDAMEDLWIRFDDFERTIDLLPLPRELYVRSKRRSLGSNFQLLKRWAVYSSTFRNPKAPS